MYGVKWLNFVVGVWCFIWIEWLLRDFYFNNVLIYEFGYLFDECNMSVVDCEVYVEWFVIYYGYKLSCENNLSCLE